MDLAHRGFGQKRGLALYTVLAALARLHRRLDRFGARREEMRRIFDTEGDWGRLLDSFAAAAVAERRK
jgi:hypothetical protein